MKTSTQQGGWIANFLIIGAVLVLGLVGTVYLVKSQGINTDIANVDSEQGPSETTGNTEDTDTNEEKTAEDQKSETSEEEAEKPAADELPSANSENDVDASASDAEELPATGPEETAISLFALSLVAFSAVSYIRSRSA